MAASESKTPSGSKEESRPPKRRRIATLYDAVAGRVGYEGFVPTEVKTSKYRDTASTSNHVLPPEEVLFRRKDAPSRYEEDDIYFRAYRNLKNEQRLPESDLLKVLHAYAAEFYASGPASANKDSKRPQKKNTKQQRSISNSANEAAFYSMDETALLALGILLEESAASVVDNSDLMEELLEQG